MLSYFTVSGHNMYAKSAYLYLTNMQKLHETHTDIYWAGVSTDLVIEQMLLKSLKSVGVWQEVEAWMMSKELYGSSQGRQLFCGTMYTTSEQHKETNITTRKRGNMNAEVIIEYMYERNPFNFEAILKKYYQWGSFKCQWCGSGKIYWRESSIKTGW